MRFGGSGEPMPASSPLYQTLHLAGVVACSVGYQLSVHSPPEPTVCRNRAGAKSLIPSRYQPFVSIDQMTAVSAKRLSGRDCPRFASSPKPTSELAVRQIPLSCRNLPLPQHRALPAIEEATVPVRFRTSVICRIDPEAKDGRAASIDRLC